MSRIKRINHPGYPVHPVINFFADNYPLLNQKFLTILISKGLFFL
jgi:hypothetical protein